MDFLKIQKYVSSTMTGIEYTQKMYFPLSALFTHIFLLSQLDFCNWYRNILASEMSNDCIAPNFLKPIIN